MTRHPKEAARSRGREEPRRASDARADVENAVSGVDAREPREQDRRLPASRVELVEQRELVGVEGPVGLAGRRECLLDPVEQRGLPVERLDGGFRLLHH